VAEVSVPSLVYAMPSPGELQAGRKKDEELDHSTAGVPVLRV